MKIKTLSLTIALALTLMASLFVMPISAADNGIVALYTFNDAANVGKDSSGNGHDLAQFDSSNVTSADGIATFGASDYLYVAPDQDFTDALTDFTFTARFKTSGVPVDNWCPIYTGWDNDAGMALCLRDGYVCIDNKSTGTNWLHYQNANGNDLYTDFHQYTITYNSHTKLMNLYIDGAVVVLSGGDANGVAIADLAMNGSTPFAIGAAANGGGWHGYSFEGQIDEVAVYNKALTAAEVAALQTVPMPNETPEETPDPAPETADALSLGIATAAMALICGAVVVNKKRR